MTMTTIVKVVTGTMSMIAMMTSVVMMRDMTWNRSMKPRPAGLSCCQQLHMSATPARQILTRQHVSAGMPLCKACKASIFDNMDPITELVECVGYSQIECVDHPGFTASRTCPTKHQNIKANSDPVALDC